MSWRTDVGECDLPHSRLTGLSFDLIKELITT